VTLAAFVTALAAGLDALPAMSLLQLALLDH
jgi:hypothetical protein